MYLYSTSHLAAHMLWQKWQFQFGNIRKMTKNSNSKLHFLVNGWLYRLEILHDNLEDQANDIFQNSVNFTSTLKQIYVSEPGFQKNHSIVMHEESRKFG